MVKPEPAACGAAQLSPPVDPGEIGPVFGVQHRAGGVLLFQLVQGMFHRRIGVHASFAISLTARALTSGPKSP
jgi:hypothetical protein